MNASRQLPVPDALLRWLDRVDLASYRADGHSCPLIHIPDPATTLVWRTIADGSSALLVVGPRTRAAYYDSKDVTACARFQLAPGAARALLGTPIDELTDHVVALSELWGPPGIQLTDQLTGLASEPMTAVKHIEAALSARARAVRPQDSTTANLVSQASIELSPKGAHPHRRVSEVARHLGVSERHLRNAFTTTVGIPPKQFARLIRIRTILPRLHREPWARLASDAGYYDQSHMTAHFREVMHVTPSIFTAGRLPTVPC
ncbi:helix-turn-helix domain-containing protein [Planotetraspora kaengkrachanensis]|uniref:AraC family transcriptional regulator n=1 Tax=Planotetraspora kaengkrachanensis TaxID=575193 RepID=A0A8J3LZ40_9ACTN|nr:helix-turn-helix domain-containing protein [Planotetraspora kaengkrachanensis]GIG80579.1 AraC family transcriptional regulator [Planotetraspora kaengkrachanensis]